jgi:hypothetical protein
MPQTLLRSMTSEDIFKAMDLNAAASVELYMPKQGRGGIVGLVPGHIRGCSNNPMRVIKMIEEFRLMRASQQDVETQKWKSMTITAQKVHKNRIAQLVTIREDLKLGLETWEDVTVEVDGVYLENEIDLPAPPEPPATDSASAMILTPAPGVSNAVAVSAEEVAASGDDENQDPKRFVGLGSDQALRATKESEAKNRSRSDKKRPLGAFAERIDQQGDSQATTSMTNAFRAVAIACDTTHYPGLVDGQPRQTIICIVVNQIADSLPQGGRMKTGGLVRNKTEVTIVGRDKESVGWAIEETLKAGKRQESPTHNRIDLFQDAESKKVLTTIVKKFEQKKKLRQQPPQNGRTGREVVDEEHVYFASPTGQQDEAVFQLRSRL